MGEQEGSKAMTIYIVVCFGLAIAALVGYKVLNDERDARTLEYVTLARQWSELTIMADNIRTYYVMRADGSIQAPDRDEMDQTHALLRNIAINDIDLNAAEQLDVIPRRAQAVRGTDHSRAGAMIRLKGVTQAEWTAFLDLAIRRTSAYATIESINLDRDDKRYQNFRAQDRDNRTRWTVTIEFVWFV
jgi:hypothetical protein